MNREEFEKLYESTLKKGIRKLRLIGFFCSHNKLIEESERLLRHKFYRIGTN